jgi:DNA (cytosine-5)-methyltransferase 1
MKKQAYYNEWDPYAAAWLRNLIAAGLIANGEVDERSIKDVHPEDVADFTQAHFFAGIGGWSYALRLAGWPDNVPVWTGSCPCQPFSSAGKGAAFSDERHLWPAWNDLIRQCRPPVIFGEQVEAAVGHGWLDAVFSDLEGQGYACGAAVLSACGVGALHLRKRLWFVANAGLSEFQGWDKAKELDYRGCEKRDFVADPGHYERPTWSEGCEQQSAASVSEWIGGGCSKDVVEHPESEQVGIPRLPRQSRESPWQDIEWIPCSDGKSRPTKPGLQPLAHGIPNRVGRLRAYGNAIVPQVAAEFISAFMECRP